MEEKEEENERRKKNTLRTRKQVKQTVRYVYISKKITQKSQIKAILKQASHSIYVIDAYVYILYSYVVVFDGSSAFFSCFHPQFCHPAPPSTFAWQRYWNRNVLMERKQTILSYVTNAIQCENFKIYCFI